MARTKKSPDYDVIVVGGGLAGLALTALLANQNVHALCVDRDNPADQLKETFDGRTTAISYGSQKILAAAGVWDLLAPDACPIKTIHILDSDSPVLLDFNSHEVNDRVFGWIIENRLLRQGLMKRVVQREYATHLAPARITDLSVTDSYAAVHIGDDVYKAPLLIGADGKNSFTRDWMGIDTRDWSYHQRAVVCAVTHEHPHNNIAVEHFRAEGPFAILPMLDMKDGTHRSSLVWTEHGADKDSALHYSQESFDAALNARFPSFYGKVRQIEKRYSFPLGLTHAHQYIAPRMALVAEAAHAIHPIAGQGLNLGYRDIAALADLVIEAVKNGDDPGSDALLQRYQRQRRFDNMAMAGTTDVLNRLFSNHSVVARAARKTGLKIVSRLPFAKQFFMNQAMGAAGLLPALIADDKAA